MVGPGGGRGAAVAQRCARSEPARRMLQARRNIICTPDGPLRKGAAGPTASPGGKRQRPRVPSPGHAAAEGSPRRRCDSPAGTASPALSAPGSPRAKHRGSAGNAFGGATRQTATLPLEAGTFHYAPPYSVVEGKTAAPVFLSSEQVDACKQVFDTSGGIGALDEKKMALVLRKLGVTAPPSKELSRLMQRADRLWSMNSFPGQIVNLSHEPREGGESDAAQRPSDGQEETDDAAVQTRLRRDAWNRLRTYRRLFDAICSCPQFDCLGWSDRAKLVDALLGCEVTVDADQFITESGQHGDDIFVLGEGAVLAVSPVEAALAAEGGDAFTRQRLGRGALLGQEILEIKGRGRYATTVTALQRSRLIRISRQTLRAHPAAHQALRSRHSVHVPQIELPAFARISAKGSFRNRPDPGERRRSPAGSRRPSAAPRMGLGVASFGTFRTLRKTSITGVPNTIGTRSAAQAAERTRFLKSFCPQHLEHVTPCMGVRSFVEGQVVLRQGEPAEEFFIIEDGECAAYQSGRLVRRFFSGEYFGTEALLNELPQPATVTATRHTNCWVIGGDTWHAYFHRPMQERRRLYAKLIRSVEVCDLKLGGDDHALHRLVALGEEVSAQPGEEIFTEGHLGDYLFYVVVSGEVTVRHGEDMSILGSGKCFGENGILYRTQQAMQATAGPRGCRLLRFDAELLLRYLGPQEVPTAVAAKRELQLQRPSHSMELGCFLSIVHELKRRHVQAAGDRSKDLVDAFAAMGGRRDRKGHVFVSTLVDTTNAFKLTIDVPQLVKEMDRDSDGNVDFSEFSGMLSGDAAKQEDLFLELGGSLNPDTGAPCGQIPTAALNGCLASLSVGVDEAVASDVVRLAELLRGSHLEFSTFVAAVLNPIQMVIRDPQLATRIRQERLLAEHMNRLFDLGKELVSNPRGPESSPLFTAMQRMYTGDGASLPHHDSQGSAGTRALTPTARIKSSALAHGRLAAIMDKGQEDRSRLQRRAGRFKLGDPSAAGALPSKKKKEDDKGGRMASDILTAPEPSPGRASTSSITASPPTKPDSGNRMRVKRGFKRVPTKTKKAFEKLIMEGKENDLQGDARWDRAQRNFLRQLDSGSGRPRLAPASSAFDLRRQHTEEVHSPNARARRLARAMRELSQQEDASEASRSPNWKPKHSPQLLRAPYRGGPIVITVTSGDDQPSTTRAVEFSPSPPASADDEGVRDALHDLVGETPNFSNARESPTNPRAESADVLGTPKGRSSSSSGRLRSPRVLGLSVGQHSDAYPPATLPRSARAVGSRPVDPTTVPLPPSPTLSPPDPSCPSPTLQLSQQQQGDRRSSAVSRRSRCSALDIDPVMAQMIAIPVPRGAPVKPTFGMLARAPSSAPPARQRPRTAGSRRSCAGSAPRSSAQTARPLSASPWSAAGQRSGCVRMVGVPTLLHVPTAPSPRAQKPAQKGSHAARQAALLGRCMHPRAAELRAPTASEGGSARQGRPSATPRGHTPGPSAQVDQLLIDALERAEQPQMGPLHATPPSVRAPPKASLASCAFFSAGAGAGGLGCAIARVMRQQPAAYY